MTKVIIDIPESDLEKNPMLAKYQGQTRSVEWEYFTTHGTIYELDGCESKMGIPYSFHKDWVRIIK
jgi:hypothetical protein